MQSKEEFFSEGKKSKTLQGIQGNRMNKTTEKITEAREQYDSYNANEWEKTFFDEKTGGYLVTEKARIVKSKKSDNEFKKFDKEQGMCKVLARNGFTVEHLDDKNGNSYDIHLNKIKADLKKTGSHNNIEIYAKDAIRKQGAEIVVFEFENNTKDIHAKILKLVKTYDIHGFFYFSHSKDKIFKF